MNTTRQLFATTLMALASAAAAPAFALTVGDADPGAPTANTSTLTRMEVRAALDQARAEGRLERGERSLVTLPSGMAKTRAQVVAETQEAIRIGAIERGERSRDDTPQQIEQIRKAGLKALMMNVASR